MSDLKSNTGLVCPTHELPKPKSNTPRMDEAIRKGGRKTPYNVATEAKNIERELAAMTKERNLLLASMTNETHIARNENKSA